MMDKGINNLEIDNKLDSLQVELNKIEDKIHYLERQIEDLSLEKEDLTKKIEAQITLINNPILRDYIGHWYRLKCSDTEKVFFKPIEYIDKNSIGEYVFSGFLFSFDTVLRIFSLKDISERGISMQVLKGISDCQVDDKEIQTKMMRYLNTRKVIDSLNLRLTTISTTPEPNN
jgi:hypothetical protein